MWGRREGFYWLLAGTQFISPHSFLLQEYLEIWELTCLVHNKHANSAGVLSSFSQVQIPLSPVLDWNTLLFPSTQCPFLSKELFIRNHGKITDCVSPFHESQIEFRQFPLFPGLEHSLEQQQRSSDHKVTLRLETPHKVGERLEDTQDIDGVNACPPWMQYFRSSCYIRGKSLLFMPLSF